MQTVTPKDCPTYYLPESEDEVVLLVNEAKLNNEIICLRGAAHSFPLIKTLEAPNDPAKTFKYVMLSKLRSVAINQAAKKVTVQAGCHLGIDPFDPTGISTLENSLLYQLDQVGLALPDLGGITHQTVGGFLSTGSSGGTTQFGFGDGLLSIDLVHYDKDGARKTTFNRPADGNPDDPFFGAALGMGLFGIVTGVTLQCCDKFYITGDEAITLYEDCELDLFGKSIAGGRPGIGDFFKNTQYTRLMWWPQANIEKVVVWKSKQSTQAEAEDYSDVAWADEGKTKPAGVTLKTYEEVPFIFDSPELATLAADGLFTAIGRWPVWLTKIFGDNVFSKMLIAAETKAFYDKQFPDILKVFVPLDKDQSGNYKGPQQFADDWYTGLPMDNQMSDELFPVWFTELWIDLEMATEVMVELKNFFAIGPENTLAFSYEIYAAKKSDLWMSPSYGMDVIRIDIFWFGNDYGSPSDSFYPKFWELLAKYKFRPHWGKYLPAPDSAQGVTYLQAQYPKWNAWMKLRAEMDPFNVFLNDYWAAHLGIVK